MEKSYLFWSIITVLAWGVTPILEKLGLLKVDASILLLLNSFIVFVVLGAYVYMNVRSGAVPIPEFSWSLVLLILGMTILGTVIGEFAYLKALSSGEAGTVVAITSIYPLITVLISMALLGERMNLTSAIGVLFIVAGVGLLAGGLSAPEEAIAEEPQLSQPLAEKGPLSSEVDI